MIKTFFLSVLEISFATSPVILLLVLLAPLLNKRYAAKWKYWIWIVLALRLLVPFGKTESELPIVIDIPKQITTPFMFRDNVEFELTPSGQAEVSSLLEDEQRLSAKTKTEQKFIDITPLNIATVVWVLGILIMLCVHGFSYVHFKRKVVQNGVSIEDESILRWLQQLIEELQIRRKIVIIKYSQVTSPMITGFIHSILVMPDETYCQEELYFILKHELLHLKRHDIYFKLLLLTVNAIHWFNPVVWLMRKEATVDMEVSCDEGVIQGMNLEARRAYTETLLSALYRQCARRIVLSTQFYGGKQVMKKRFKNILMETRKKNGLSLVICTFVLTLAMGSLVGCSIKETASDENEIKNIGTEYAAGIVNVGTLRVRGEPDEDAHTVMLLPNGKEVTILAEENEFYQILCQEEDDTIEGYVRKEYVDVDSMYSISEEND